MLGGYTRRNWLAGPAFYTHRQRCGPARGCASATTRRGQRRLLLANDSKAAGSFRWPHHPPGVQSDAPAVPLQVGPFERPGNRHGQCGPIGRAQDAVVGVQTAPLGGTGEISKVQGTGPRNADAAGGVTGAAARGRHRQHRPIHKASTQLGDADLPRPIASLLRRSQRCAIVARRCRGNIRRRWPVGC